MDAKFCLPHGYCLVAICSVWARCIVHCTTNHQLSSHESSSGKPCKKFAYGLIHRSLVQAVNKIKSPVKRVSCSKILTCNRIVFCSYESLNSPASSIHKIIQFQPRDRCHLKRRPDAWSYRRWEPATRKPVNCETLETSKYIQDINEIVNIKNTIARSYFTILFTQVHIKSQFHHVLASGNFNQLHRLFRKK